ncbi:hypothetical protein [Sulfobacillus thermosulfidooxidans]|uniref:hypothetical protein n=1 Tax=Sulfobacillus thermosulfidooxidans TaxID=28034 RepID=UPI0006B42689|nr:hypothetical protein [Sulfobacillus thermosulfidooxidans]
MLLLQILMILQGVYAVNRLVRLHFQGDWPYRWQSSSIEGWAWLKKWQNVYRTVYTFYSMLLGQTILWLILLKNLSPSTLNLWLLLSLGMFVVIFVILSRHMQVLVRQIFEHPIVPPPSFDVLYRFLIHPPAIDQ